jgi:hypothetical protein
MPVGQQLMTHAQSLRLPPELALPGAEAEAEVPRLRQDEQLGGLVRGRDLWHADLQRVEGVLEVDAALALERVVEIAHPAPFHRRAAANAVRLVFGLFARPSELLYGI